MDILDKLKELVKHSEDELPECMLDAAGIEYKEVSDIDWQCERKYDYGNYDVEIEGRFFSFSVSRTGSYYTDYYRSIDDVVEYKPDTRYHVNFTFPSKEVAKEFINWMSNHGEQTMWESGDLELNRDVEYNYEDCSMEIKNKFEE